MLKKMKKIETLILPILTWQVIFYHDAAQCAVPRFADIIQHQHIFATTYAIVHRYQRSSTVIIIFHLEFEFLSKYHTIYAIQWLQLPHLICSQELIFRHRQFAVPLFQVLFCFLLLLISYLNKVFEASFLDSCVEESHCGQQQIECLV